ncbi:MAG: hypothetical protein WB791_02800 [Waddliaceae bacterium]
MNPKKGTYIRLQAKPGKENALANLLTAGGGIVKETEPATLLWFALQLDDTTFGIFDLFPNEAGRSAHFAGEVAKALQEKASDLVEGGWNEGVIKNVENCDVLASKIAPAFPPKLQEATLIHLTANRGKEIDLADFLTGGAPLVEETEPETLYWFALQFDENHFGIFDLFADPSGREKHFAGEVAKALEGKAPDLVQGGWGDGVLKNIKNYTVLASNH